MNILNFDRPPRCFAQLREGDLFYIRGAEKNLFLKIEEINVAQSMSDDYIFYNAVNVNSGHLITVFDGTSIIPVVVNAHENCIKFIPIAY